MQANPCKSREQKEAKIQTAIIKYLRHREWYVKRMVGSSLQSGVPDLFACHYNYGHRWIEVKLPGMKGSKFTNAQLKDFPKFCANGSGVWIMTGATDEEYKKLMNTANWYQYLGIWK